MTETEIQIFQCPGGCPPGECDTNGAGEEGEWPCPLCDGSGATDDLAVPCPKCRGDGKCGGFSTATCSKCGQSAMSRAMWEGP